MNVRELITQLLNEDMDDEVIINHEGQNRAGVDGILRSDAQGSEGGKVVLEPTTPLVVANGESSDARRAHSLRRFVGRSSGKTPKPQ